MVSPERFPQYLEDRYFDETTDSATKEKIIEVSKTWAERLPFSEEYKTKLGCKLSKANIVLKLVTKSAQLQ